MTDKNNKITLQETNKKLDKIIEYLKAREKHKESDADREFWKLFNIMDMDPESRATLEKFKKYYDINDRNISLNNLEKINVINFKGIFDNVMKLLKIENIFNYTFANNKTFDETDLININKLLKSKIDEYSELFNRIINVYTKQNNMHTLHCKEIGKEIFVDNDKCKLDDKLLMNVDLDNIKMNDEIKKNNDEINRLNELLKTLEKKAIYENMLKDLLDKIKQITGKDLDDSMIAAIKDTLEYNRLEIDLQSGKYIMLQNEDILKYIMRLVTSRDICEALEGPNAFGWNWLKSVYYKNNLHEESVISFFTEEKLQKTENLDMNRIVDLVTPIINKLRENILPEKVVNEHIINVLRGYYDIYNSTVNKATKYHDANRIKNFIDKVLKDKLLPKKYSIMIMIIKCLCIDEKLIKFKPVDELSIWSNIKLDKNKFLKSYIIHSTNL